MRALVGEHRRGRLTFRVILPTADQEASYAPKHRRFPETGCPATRVSFAVLTSSANDGAKAPCSNPVYWECDVEKYGGGAIEVRDYDPKWPVLFDEECARL